MQINMSKLYIMLVIKITIGRNCMKIGGGNTDFNIIKELKYTQKKRAKVVML